MPDPMGISFMPNEENSLMGPRRGARESDLQQAWKILSLRMPAVLGGRSPLNQTLARGRGSAGLASGVNPNSAAYRALVSVFGGHGAPDPSVEYARGPFGGGTAPAPGTFDNPTPRSLPGGGGAGAGGMAGYGGSAPSPLDQPDPAGRSRYGRRG